MLLESGMMVVAPSLYTSLQLFAFISSFVYAAPLVCFAPYLSLDVTFCDIVSALLVECLMTSANVSASLTSVFLTHPEMFGAYAGMKLDSSSGLDVALM